MAEQSKEEKRRTTAAVAAIYRQEGDVRRRQRTNELAMVLATCQCTRKRRKSIGGDNCVAPAASREVALG